MKFLLNKKWLVLAIIFTMSLVASLMFLLRVDFSFTVLSYKHLDYHHNPSVILPGSPVQGEFVAFEDGLALLAFRFDTLGRKNDDIVEFRLKEKGAKDWQVSTKVRTTFSDEDFYNFGFFPIASSKGKQYIFEIVSTRGTPDNAVGVSALSPVLATKYQIDKNLIKQSFSTLLSYAFKKLHNSFVFTDAFLPVLTLFLPLLCYLTFVCCKDIFQRFALNVVIVFTLANIFFIKPFYDEVVVFLLLAWWFVYFALNRLNKLIWASLGFWVATFLANLFNLLFIDKLASWAFMLMVVAVFYEIFILIKNSPQYKHTKSLPTQYCKNT